MNRVKELKEQHERLLEKTVKDIMTNGVIMDKQQMEQLSMLARSKSFLQGYIQGHKDAQEGGGE